MIQFLLQMIAVFIGTIGFSILYNTPRKHFLWAGLTGTMGWIVYEMLNEVGYPRLSCFGAALFVGLVSRILAIKKQCPAITFAIAGLFPLVPGSQIYYTIYYMMTVTQTRALYQGVETLKTALAIVMGIIVALAFPQSLFSRLGKIKIKNNF